MADAKQFLDLAGLKKFWGIIKNNFITNVGVITDNTNGSVFTLTYGDNDTKSIKIPAATEQGAGIMTTSQVATLNGLSSTIESSINLKGVAFSGKLASTSTVDGTNKCVNLDIKYDSDKKQIQVIDLNNSDYVLTSFDATAFIKDSFLNSAKIGDNNGKTGLILEFITKNPVTGESELSPIFVDLTSFVDTYTGSNAISVKSGTSSKVISLKIDINEKYLTINGNGLATTGIDNAISVAAEAAKNAAIAKAGELDAALKNELIGANTNDKTKDTIWGAKKYAEAEADAAEAAANNYTNTEIGKINTKIGDVPTGSTVVGMITSAAGKAEENANKYTDGEIGKINAKIGTIPEGSTIVGMITSEANKTLAAANNYTDAEIAKITAIPPESIEIDELDK